MASYTQLKKQLETLQAQVESARQAELLPIIKRMQREMATHGISAADLATVADLEKGAAKKVAGKKSAKGAGAPKFKDPKSGLTWSGFGRAPGWIAGKRDRTKFLIDGGNEAQGSPLAMPKTVTRGRMASNAPAKKSPASAPKKVAKAAKKVATPTDARAKNVGKRRASGLSKETASQVQTPDTAQPAA